MKSAKDLAAQIDEEIRALPVRNTPNSRAVRRTYSQRLRHSDADFVLAVARELLSLGYRDIPYELVRHHAGAFESLDEVQVEAFGEGIDSWWSVDSFARTLAGPAWLSGHISDSLIRRWSGSADLWWRRAALVSTVALNVRSQGGYGDVPRTLAICRLLVDDHEDMVVKAMSWALRELVGHDPDAVEEFLDQHESALAARVKREVRNKLRTGRKNPRKTQ